MCEEAASNCFTPAAFAACIGNDEVMIEFPNSPGHGSWVYGTALKERFPILPSDPQECVKIIRDLSERGIIRVAVLGNNGADRDRCPTSLRAIISVVPRSEELASRT